MLSSFFRKIVKWANVVYIPRFWYPAIFLAKKYKKSVIVHLHDYIPKCPLSNFFNVMDGVNCNRGSWMCSQRCIYAYERMNRRHLVGAAGSTILNSTFGCYYGRIIAVSDVAICVSNAQKNLLLKNRAYLPPKICVIYNPLPDITEYSLEFQGDDFGYFGGPNYLKGFPVLYKAATIVKNVKSVRIHATNFSGINNQSGFLNSVGILVYGRLDPISYKDLYKKIRAVIVPSLWEEPLPYVVSEALISGRIVIASRVGGIPEQVAGCKGAFLFEAGDYKALAEIILHVKDLNKDKVVKLGMQNREFALKKFNSDKIAKSFISLLEKVAN
jgi:glycosyltransferase involved in cell wall biosynthesis